MRNLTKTSKLTTSFKQSELTPSELKKLKGGILLTCEEKRGNLFGFSYSYDVWRLKSDGKLGLTVDM